jgi:hypothetical protein
MLLVSGAEEAAQQMYFENARRIENRQADFEQVVVSLIEACSGMAFADAHIHAVVPPMMPAVEQIPQP